MPECRAGVAVSCSCYLLTGTKHVRGRPAVRRQEAIARIDGSSGVRSCCLTKKWIDGVSYGEGHETTRPRIRTPRPSSTLPKQEADMVPGRPGPSLSPDPSAEEDPRVGCLESLMSTAVAGCTLRRGGHVAGRVDVTAWTEGQRGTQSFLHRGEVWLPGTRPGTHHE